MTKLTEFSIENFTIELLETLGYQYIYAPDIAPDGEKPERSSYEDVLLTERLQNAIKRINPKVPIDSQKEALKEIQRINSPDLLANNEQFHRMLTEGINVSYQKDGHQRGDLVWLIDFENPENNEFVVTNQFTVIENGNNKRPDVVLFVNGIPLVVIELKNPADENATIHSAYRQLQTYKQTIPSLFVYNGFMLISDGLEAKAGSLSAEFSRFMAWKSSDGKEEASNLVSQLEILIKGMLNKKTLLDLIRHFIVFQKARKEDPETGTINISTTKILAAYHQYYAVNKAVESTLRASGYIDKIENMANENIESHGLSNRKGGVIWHTQGSGKSLSMVFYTGKIVLVLDNPTILVITDRNDLDNQLFDTFAASTQLLRQEPKQAESREDLKNKLKVASGGIVFSTIQKFQPENGNVYKTLSERENIIVIADEAHRTQYGFKAKIDKQTGDISYGFAKYLHEALPNATFMGFTGTPIEKTDRNTRAVFGNYVDIYDIQKAVEDKITVPIYYESRLARVYLSEKGKKLIADFDKEFEDDLSETEKAKAKWTKLEALIGSNERIKKVAEDIVDHFKKRQEVFEGKGMIIAASRRIAVKLYNEIIKIRPEWHNEDLRKGTIKIVMTSESSDGPEIAKHHTTKDQRRMLADRIKDPQDELKLVIVVDMWLTGFDVPCLHTMYIDKPMKGHNLIQAIARVNRVYKDKPGGLIVDYLGIANELKEALSFYSNSGGRGDPIVAQEQAVGLMIEKFEVVSQMFYGFNYKRYFNADTSEKLSIILAAEEHILNLENGKKRYIDAVSTLSKAFAISIPNQKALALKDEIAFFQAVQSRLLKFDRKNTGKNSIEKETAIRQIIDKALVTDKVIDIFDAAGIKKPNISVLSEEFLMEVKNMKHRNIAIEVLKKIINGEIKARTRRNFVQSKSLIEMLENSIRRYNNKVITATEVIEELIKIAQEIKEADKKPKEMGLSEYEYAFYTAISNNKSAKEVMGKEKLRELAVVLFEKIKKNVSIDWTIKESVKAKLKVLVKRTLRKYGYPPDMQKLATETVLKQAELIADELTSSL